MSSAEEREAWLAELPEPVGPGRHYPRAQIVEAVIEIRCDAPSVGVEQLVEAVDSSNFPQTEKMFDVLGTVNIEPEKVGGETTVVPVGYRFHKENPREAIQARLNGFSYSWLDAYQSWEDLRDHAEIHWLKYLETARPVRAQRLGVRYINRYVFDRSVEIGDYLRMHITVPAYLPQTVEAYFLRAQIPIKGLNCSVNISSALQPANDGHTALILDIDAWQGVDIDLKGPNRHTEITSRLEDLRLAKNYAFESCITDATRGLIE